MKNYRVDFSEKLKYDRSFNIEVPDEMDELELDSIMSAAQRKANYYEDFGFAYDVFEIHGIKITERADESLDSPQNCEFDIYDFDEVEE